MKHTQGPWKLGKTCVGIPAVFGPDRNQAICLLGLKDGHALENAEANGPLLATAPELLALVELAANQAATLAALVPEEAELYRQDERDFRAAIAKATA